MSTNPQYMYFVSVDHWQLIITDAWQAEQGRDLDDWFREDAACWGTQVVTQSTLGRRKPWRWLLDWSSSLDRSKAFIHINGVFTVSETETNT